MKAGTGMPGEMRALLRRNGILLTGSARAARDLHRRYAEAMQAEGESAWATPAIFDLHSWLTQQWNALLLTGSESRALLNTMQEQQAWEAIIGPSIRQVSLMEPARLATLARGAYSLLASYDALGWLDEKTWMADPNAEPMLFRRWAGEFQQACMRQGWLPGCELITVIAQAFERRALSAPPEIAWLGFDRETPAHQGLQRTLAARGTVQQSLSWDGDATVPRLYEAAGEQEENLACAAWVRANPQARIGILMPDLATRRAQLERDFYRVLAPERFSITAGGAPSLPFEFSLGQPLAEVPLIRAALLTLRWLEEPLAQHEISWLLLASALGATQGASAREAMAALDRRLRRPKVAAAESSLSAFLRSSRNGVPAVEALLRDLGTIERQHHRAPSQARPGEWLRHVSRLLEAAQWGRRTDASSLLYQAREAWERMLEQIAALDATQRPIPFREFLRLLERAARETIFAPESEGAPVQVMGVYAASGLCFDAVWFLGATDNAWPTGGYTHPLLPQELQRAYGMPHASADEDMALAQRAMDHIGATEVVYSWAKFAGDAMQRPSPLVSGFEHVPDTLTYDAQETAPLETIDDSAWTALPQGARASGGQSTLKQQAACPFQAFLLQRLRANEMEMAGHGLSPADRGNLVHKVLDGIWSDDVDGHIHLSTRDDLRQACAAGSLRALVAAHTRRAMNELTLPRETAWQRTYLDAEAQRTIALVMEWLEFESQREPFTVISTEKKEILVVGDLSLSVRADRIDRVAGGTLLIDYKTGDVSTTSWEGVRPEEPQLPLYATFGHPEGLVGAAFAQVRPRDTVFRGLVQDSAANLFAAKGPQQLDPLTPETQQAWHDTLLALAAAFARGEAQVDPRKRAETCTFCPLHGVCRIAEVPDGESEDADEEDEV